MNPKFNNFNLVKKPLLVNEAGVMIYLYTDYLAAKTKTFSHLRSPTQVLTTPRI